MNLNKLFSFLILSVILLSCFSDGQSHKDFVRCKPTYEYYNQSNYDIDVGAYTPDNIAVDTSNLNINLSKIDRLTTEVENCLKSTFENGILTNDVVESSKCINNKFDLNINRSCLVVKVADDWFLSKYEYNGTLHQQLPYTNGGQCTNKGLPAGVCYYRVAIQDSLTIVVPPSFYLFKDGLVRVATGCVDPWSSEKLANCMNPTTNPLDDGTQP